jgi:hypothetical protein
LERFSIRICEFLVKSNPREDLQEIFSRVFPARVHGKFERWKQHRRRGTANLFRLSCLDHLLTNTAQREEPQSGSVTTVNGGILALKKDSHPIQNTSFCRECSLVDLASAAETLHRAQTQHYPRSKREREEPPRDCRAAGHNR